MKEKNKLLGEERRELLLKLLRDSSEPITGSELAAKANVSRQVIVGDITLLKAKNEPIIATSQGYVYFDQPVMQNTIERIIACFHPPNKTEEELYLLVDHGVTVKDVRIEHPVYGDLTASIMVSNRKEAEQFIHKIHQTKAAYLSELTDGFHLHTISAKSEKQLNEAEASLKKAGFLIEE